MTAGPGGIVVSVSPAILSAHLARVDDPELGGADGLLLVFNIEIDAAALGRGAFVVSRATQGPVRPERAIFAPANENDENRTVLLIGDFGGAAADQGPTHVAVSGPLFAENGAPLQGLGSTVTPFDDPPRVVAAVVLASAPGRCEGAARSLRTYWSDELRGVEPSDTERVRIRVGTDEAAHPLRFDDHTTLHQEAGQDNVLDLCLDDAGAVRRVWVEAGVFRDPAGHASAAVELRLDDLAP